MASTSANMGLQIPEVEDSDYPSSIEESLESIDGHDHSSGKGVPISSTGIAAGGVATSNLADGVLSANATGRGKMADGFLSADSTGRAKMADGFVTRAKLEDFGQQVSSEITFNTTSTSEVDVTNATVSLDAVGRPVKIFLNPVSGGGMVKVATSFTEDDGAATIYLYEGVTLIATFPFKFDFGGGASIEYRVPPTIISFFHTPTSGSKTYKLTASVSGASRALDISGCKLVAHAV